MKVAAAISLPGRRTPNLWSLIFQIVFWVLTEIYRVVVSDIFWASFRRRERKPHFSKFLLRLVFFGKNNLKYFFCITFSLFQILHFGETLKNQRNCEISLNESLFYFQSHLWIKLELKRLQSSIESYRAVPFRAVPCREVSCRVIAQIFVFSKFLVTNC